MRKSLVYMILLGMMATQVNAQTLHGLFSVSGGDRQLGTINASNGVCSLLGSPIAGGSLSTSSGVSAINDSGNLFYFVGTFTAVTSIYSVNTTTGAASAAIISVAPVGLEYDEPEGTLYTVITNSGFRDVGTLNPSTGAYSQIWTSGASVSSSSGNNALDPGGNIFYFLGNPGSGEAIYSINTSMGSGSSVTLSPAFSVSGLEFDGTTLYALVNPGGGDRQLATINPGTGAITTLGMPINGGSLSSVGGATAFNLSTNDFYFIGTPMAGQGTYVVTTAGAATFQLNSISEIAALEFKQPPLPVELITISVD